MIAGTNSGCGKTTVASGIMAALVKRGLKVQPFKVGPDYIDPMFHSFITGTGSRNLDSWMLDRDTLIYLFKRSAKSADISVVEGVMGMYDGLGGRDDTGSSAHVSKIIRCPVILVIDGEGMSLSIAAIVKGFRDFDRNVAIKGVIINNISSDAHYKLLKDIIEENTGTAVLGYLPATKECALESRHLGLVPAVEVKGLKGKLGMLSAKTEETVDLDLLLKIAGNAGSLPDGAFEAGFEFRRKEGLKPEDKVRIGVARDKAFNFYYQDNLDLLEMLGAELVFFSPLEDLRLPGGIDGLYMGGGYPEVWAEELEVNQSIRADIKGKILSGLPAYAECGGLMYMSESIRTLGGKEFEMVGLLPGRSEMTSSLKRFGYVNVEVMQDNILSRKGWSIRAHEFHYSSTFMDESVPSCFRVFRERRGGEGTSWNCGFRMYNLLAGYPHLHFWSNPDFAANFIENCRRIKREHENQ